MIIEIFDNGLEKEDCIGLEKRTACRGIVFKDDLFLTVHIEKFDITTFPGGGLEDDETLEECVEREVLEETGIRTKVKAQTVTVLEYFSDVIWESHFFLCDFIEDSKKRNLTDEEKEILMVTRWLKIDELMDIFENNMTKHKNGPNIHNREFLGLINSI